jgi:hypothetical protein
MKLMGQCKPAGGRPTVPDTPEAEAKAPRKRGTRQHQAFCEVLFYRRNGEPWLCRILAVPYPGVRPGLPVRSSEDATSGHMCLLCMANVTASTCPTIGDITLGRHLGSGAFGTVFIGMQP